MLTSDQLLEPLAARRTDEAMVTAMSVVRPWGRLSDHDLDFASADAAMGHSADLALGIAIAQPARKVICLNGDGSMLMCLGTLATIVDAGAENMILFVVVNGTYEITGNQPTPAAGRLDFAGMARAAGFSRVFDFDDAAEYEAHLDEILTAPGPTFISVHVEPGCQGPISRTEAEPARYLKGVACRLVAADAPSDDLERMSERDGAWYEDGLRFECTMCGNCCTGFPGTVTVNDAEITALAERLELTDDDFRERFTRHMPNGTISLREKPDYDCVFYGREQGCLVYEDRPTQCRNWPFWRTNVRSRDSWDAAAEGCPGMNGGRLYTLEEIEERAGVTP